MAQWRLLRERGSHGSGSGPLIHRAVAAPPLIRELLCAACLRRLGEEEIEEKLVAYRGELLAKLQNVAAAAAKPSER